MQRTGCSGHDRSHPPPAFEPEARNDGSLEAGSSVSSSEPGSRSGEITSAPRSPAGDGCNTTSRDDLPAATRPARARPRRPALLATLAAADTSPPPCRQKSPPSPPTPPRRPPTAPPGPGSRWDCSRRSTGSRSPRSTGRATSGPSTSTGTAGSTPRTAATPPRGHPLRSRERTRSHGRLQTRWGLLAQCVRQPGGDRRKARLDVDHFMPLAEVYDSEQTPWSGARRTPGALSLCGHWAAAYAPGGRVRTPVRVNLGCGCRWSNVPARRLYAGQQHTHAVLDLRAESGATAVGTAVQARSAAVGQLLRCTLARPVALARPPSTVRCARRCRERTHEVAPPAGLLAGPTLFGGTTCRTTARHTTRTGWVPGR